MGAEDIKKYQFGRPGGNIPGSSREVRALMNANGALAVNIQNKMLRALHHALDDMENLEHPEQIAEAARALLTQITPDHRGIVREAAVAAGYGAPSELEATDPGRAEYDTRKAAMALLAALRGAAETLSQEAPIDVTPTDPATVKPERRPVARKPRARSEAQPERPRRGRRQPDNHGE